jgi:elongation factor P
MEIQRNSIIYYKNALMRVIDVEFFKPGKGQVTYRTTLKDLIKDTTVLVSFRAKEKVQYATDVIEYSATFLYRDRDQLVFSGDKSQELVYVHTGVVAPLALSLITNALGEVVCRILMRQQEVLRVMLPTTVRMTVVEVTQNARPSDTSNPSTYPIKLAGNTEVKAPHFIKLGDVVVLSTETNSYLRRESI